MLPIIIPFGSELHKKEIELRTLVLRIPLGLEYSEEELLAEQPEIHLGLIDEEWNLRAVTLIRDAGDKVAKLRQFAVDPDFQGNGWGRFLLQFAEAVAAEEGFHRIELHAREYAMPFYQKAGYEIVGERFEEVGIPHFKMKKSFV